jgi:hypothetical protein
MPFRLLAGVAAPILLAATISGCGFTDPYQAASGQKTTAAPSTATSPADRGDPAPERGGSIPPAAQRAESKLASSAGWSSPTSALEHYAAVYLNWDAAHVVQTQRRLAAISLGQARAQALQAAASASRDPQLTRSQLANEGEVIGLSPGESAAAGQWVLVTREHTTGVGDYGGLPPTLHIIYGQVTRSATGFVVSEWVPQN